MDVGTRQRRLLPLWEPVFSPDGRRVVYFNLPYQDVGDPLWLADVNEQAAWGEEWENVRQLGRGAGTNVMDVSWSPDGERLALILLGSRADPDEYGISIYDLATERLTPLVSLSELEDIVRSSEGYLSLGDVDPTSLETGSLYYWQFTENAWSADGRYLIFDAINVLAGQVYMATLLIPLDGSPPRMLDWSRGYVNAAWSPSDPNRLAFTYNDYDSDSSGGYLLDLESGSIYTTTQVLSAAWSPDGEWLAFDGQDQLAVVDQEGQPRSVLNHDCDLVYPTWNPAADLTPPASECRAGLDLWLDERDIYLFENTFVIVVHNSGDQEARDVRLRFTSGGDEDVELPYYYINASVEHVAPPCGGLLLRVAVRGELSGPLTVSVNPPDEPGALPELDYENNQVTLEKPDF
jgi:Tol biopolymer transport system component